MRRLRLRRDQERQEGHTARESLAGDEGLHTQPCFLSRLFPLSSLYVIMKSTPLGPAPAIPQASSQAYRLPRRPLPSFLGQVPRTLLNVLSWGKLSFPSLAPDTAEEWTADFSTFCLQHRPLPWAGFRLGNQASNHQNSKHEVPEVLDQTELSYPRPGWRSRLPLTGDWRPRWILSSAFISES